MILLQSQQVQQLRYTDCMATKTAERRTVMVRVYEDSRDLLNQIAAIEKISVAEIIEPFVKARYPAALAKANELAKQQND